MQLVRFKDIFYFSFISILLIILSYFFIDIPLLKYLYNFKNSLVYNFCNKITDIGKAEYQLIPALFLYLFFKRKNRKVANIALIIFISVAIAGVTTDIIKYLLGRYRPIEFLENGNYGFQFLQIRGRYTSMPSGHTTTFFTACYLLAIFFNRYKYIFIFLGLGLAATRIVTLNHYLSDIIAGIFIAVVISNLVLILIKKKGFLNSYEHDNKR